MCINPIKKSYIIENGKVKINWSSSGASNSLKQDNPDIITLPCGKCNECRRAKSYEWALRCYLESTYHKHNCMVTLTYDNAHNDGELHKRDLQLFFKRLRKSIYPAKLRYFGCGEYGSRGGRPHYHICIFGYCPNDLEYFFTSNDSKEKIYKSKSLADIWGLGYISVGELTMQGALYSSLYMQKYNSVENKITKPFLVMSRRPGIANNFIEHIDYNQDCIYIHGKSYKIPRFFDKKLLPTMSIEQVNAIKSKRVDTALMLALPYEQAREKLIQDIEREIDYRNYRNL